MVAAWIGNGVAMPWRDSALTSGARQAELGEAGQVVGGDELTGSSSQSERAAERRGAGPRSAPRALPRGAWEREDWVPPDGDADGDEVE